MYDDPLPENIKKMKNGIYDYLIPVLLTLLLNHKDKYNNFNFTVLNFANTIKMINDNYIPMSKNIEYTNDKLKISKNMLIEYFKRIDNLIAYYITHAMDLLKDADIAKWKEYYMLCVIQTDTHLKLQPFGSVSNKYKVDSHVSTSYRLATQEEIDWIDNLKNKIQEILKINTVSECYFGKKSDKYKVMFQTELLKRDILFDFKMYQLQYQQKSELKTKLLLNTYDEQTEPQRINELNKAFQDLINKTAEKRYNKDVSKYSNRYTDNYLDFYNLLVGVTIDHTVLPFDDLPKHNGALNYDLIDVYLNNEKVRQLEG